MGIFDYFRKKKKENAPLVTRVNLTEMQKQREEELKNREVAILAAADYTKRIPTIRLYHVTLKKVVINDTNETKIIQTYRISNPFRLPNEMNMKDACKVISYLSEKIETENNLEPGCKESVSMLCNILRDYGFEKVESKEGGNYQIVSDYNPLRKIKSNRFSACQKLEGVEDLFVFNGDLKLFKKSELNNRYFDWFTENVTKQDVEDIYKKIGQKYLLQNDSNIVGEKDL